jgi:hypothetical protein
MDMTFEQFIRNAITAEHRQFTFTIMDTYDLVLQCENPPADIHIVGNTCNLVKGTYGD